MASLFDEPIRAENIPVSPLMLAPDADSDDSSVAITSALEKDIINKIVAPLEGDADFYEAVSFYEEAIIRGSLSRHRVVTKACSAINLARSTFDDKRGKLGIK
jgi:hypothetical protein